MLGLNKDIVRLVPHEDDWHLEYEKERKILEKVMAGYALDIQHVGSTSLPGISAKPILDIAVAVKDKKALEELIPIMTDAGYDVKNSIDDLGEILARKGTPDCRTHYIHIEVLGSEFWNDHILFRDYLLNHPEYIPEYEKVKVDAFNHFKDERKKYTSAKNDFIQKILKLAQDEK